MRALTCAVVATLLIPAGAPSVAAAQPGRGGAVDSCSEAVQYEVRNRYPQARHVRFTTSDARPVSGREVRVEGRGEFEDRNGGDSRFSYGCTYNQRTGATYGLDVSGVKHAGNGGKNNDAAIAGLLLGAIVVGAIVAGSSKDKDKNKGRDEGEWWSPEDGVRCNSRQAQCYRNGEYSERWTRRIFVR